MDAREPNPANRAGVKGSPAGWAAMRSRMACDVLMAASVLDNLPKYLTVHKAHVVNKKPLRLSSGPFLPERRMRVVVMLTPAGLCQRGSGWQIKRAPLPA